MDTVHAMIPDSKGKIYCARRNRIVKWSDEFAQQYCNTCVYYNGTGAGSDDDVVVECKYKDGSKDIAVTLKDSHAAMSHFKVLYKSKTASILVMKKAGDPVFIVNEPVSPPQPSEGMRSNEQVMAQEKRSEEPKLVFPTLTPTQSVEAKPLVFKTSARSKEDLGGPSISAKFVKEAVIDNRTFTVAENSDGFGFCIYDEQGNFVAKDSSVDEVVEHAREIVSQMPRKEPEPVVPVNPAPVIPIPPPAPEINVVFTLPEGK